MKIVKTVKELKAAVRKLRSRGLKVGFVPTMGYFHEGHVSLMRQAARECGAVVVSLFVNPTQFGPKEDLSRYPRDLSRDARMAKSAGADILFVPSVKEVYPAGASTTVDPGPLGDVLCGAFRSGHFRGVLTVVAKLLNMVSPDVLYLGQKDAQQVVVIRKMVTDLDFPVVIRVGKTVREPDGLAMSSRNAYLSPTERKEAAALSIALELAARLVSRGARDPRKIINEIKKLLLEETSASIEYISCVTSTDLQPVRRIKGQVLIALAVRFPSARLIDNIVVNCNDAAKR